MGHFYFYFLETEFLCVATKHYWKKTAEPSMRSRGEILSMSTLIKLYTFRVVILDNSMANLVEEAEQRMNTSSRIVEFSSFQIIFI